MRRIDSKKRRFILSTLGILAGLASIIYTSKYLKNNKTPSILKVNSLEELLSKKINKISTYTHVQTSSFNQGGSNDGGNLYKIRLKAKFDNEVNYDGVRFISLPNNPTYLLVADNMTNVCQFGLEEQDNASFFFNNLIKSGDKIRVDINLYYDQNLSITENDISIYGKGSILCKYNLGADIVVSSNNCNWDLKIKGNIKLLSKVKYVDKTMMYLSTYKVVNFTVGDQFLVRSEDDFKRVLFIGNVTRVIDDKVYFTPDAIDGSINELHSESTLELILGNNYHGALRFENCININIGRNYSYSERDLEFFNVQRIKSESLILINSNLLFQFSSKISLDNITSIESRYYGITFQGCNEGNVGNVIVQNPGFSGIVIKGSYAISFIDCYIIEAPVMAIQLVQYMGTLPSFIDSKLPNDYMCKNISFNHIYIRGGNWILAVKATAGLHINSLFSTGAYKALYLDEKWKNVIIETIKIDSHSKPTANNVAMNSSAAIYAKNGSNLVFRNIFIIDIFNDSENGSVFLKDVNQCYLNITASRKLNGVKILRCQNTVVEIAFLKNVISENYLVSFKENEFSKLLADKKHLIMTDKVQYEENTYSHTNLLFSNEK